MLTVCFLIFLHYGLYLIFLTIFSYEILSVLCYKMLSVIWSGLEYIACSDPFVSWFAVFVLCVSAAVEQFS